MRKLLNYSLPLIASSLWFFLPQAIAAESADETSAPVEWTADGEFTVRVENDIRIVEMQDNVKVTQGNLVITGERAVFEYTVQGNDLIRVTVYGSPVNYQQERETTDGTVTGSSDIIILFEDELTTNTLIEMKGNATIQTEDSLTSCAELIYDTELNIIPSSTGPCGGSISSPPSSPSN